MMTQADILAKNDKTLLVDNAESRGDMDIEEGSDRPNKPSSFGREFPKLDNIFNLNEQSPIRPSKYFASDSAMNTSKGLRKIIIGGIIFAVIVTVALFIQILFGPNQVPNRIGIVTQEPVCSEIGADMVRQGGNSVDAFIASELCLGVLNPFAAGFGAGGFLVLRDHKHGNDLALNCFFKSSKEFKASQTAPVSGPDSVAVPGELKCMQFLYHKHAKLYWKTLAAPSVKLARDGFQVSKSLAQHLQKLDIDTIKANQILADMFIDSNEQLVKEGATIKNPKLAQSLESLIRNEYVLYNHGGELAKELVKALRDENKNERISLDDLVSYSEVESKPEVINYDDFVVMTTTYPSMGPVFKFIFELADYMSKVNPTDFQKAEVYAQIVEMSRLGYSFASHLADPIQSLNLNELYIKSLSTAKQYLESLNSTSTKYPFEPIIMDDDIVVNSVAVNDHNDYMVSYVGTLGSSWGSKLFTQNGYFLNNGLSLFSYENIVANEAIGNSADNNKQPRALMAPILTYNLKNPCVRRFSMCYTHGHSMPGDDFAITELTQILMKLFADSSFYDNIITDKRVQFSPDLKEIDVCFERGFDAAIQTRLMANNDFSLSSNCTFHGISMIMKKDHIVYGQADTNRSQASLVVFN